jgi:undecaprenyl-diphosphatase
MEILKRFDTAVSKWVLSWPAKWQSILAGVSFFGEPWVVLAIAASGWLSAVGRGQNSVEWAFFWAGIAYGINTLIKQLTRRHRPHNRRVSMLGIKSYSFPSGHAFGAVIFYGLYSYLDYRYLSSPFNLILVLLLLVLTVLIGVSRVRLGTHYPTDVIGGWFLGAVALLIIIWRVF